MWLLQGTGAAAPWMAARNLETRQQRGIAVITPPRVLRMLLSLIPGHISKIYLWHGASSIDLHFHYCVILQCVNNASPFSFGSTLELPVFGNADNAIRDKFPGANIFSSEQVVQCFTERTKVEGADASGHRVTKKH